MRLVSIDQPESENPNEETSFEIEEEDALTQGGFFKIQFNPACIDKDINDKKLFRSEV